MHRVETWWPTSIGSKNGSGFAQQTLEMANLLAKLWARLVSKRTPLSIMIVGLDNSGKTSILDSLANSTNADYLSSSAHSTSTMTRSQAQVPSTVDGDMTSDFDRPTRSQSVSDKRRECEPLGGSLVDDNSISKNGNGNIIPTVGYNFERLQYKNLTMTVLDFSGQNKYRSLWQEFYNGVDAVVFVIDSSDLIRFVVVRDELENMLNHPYFVALSDIDSDSGGSNGDSRVPGEDNRSNLKRHHAPALSSTSSSTLSPPSSSWSRGAHSDLLAQKQLTISQGKLIQSPLGGLNSPTSSSSSPTTGGRGSSTVQSSASSSSIRKRTRVPILFLANKTDLANSVDTEAIVKALNLNQLPSKRHPWFIQATSVGSGQGILEGFDWLADQLTKAGQ